MSDRGDIPWDIEDDKIVVISHGILRGSMIGLVSHGILGDNKIGIISPEISHEI